MLTAALFVIVKSWKLYICPSTRKWTICSKSIQWSTTQHKNNELLYATYRRISNYAEERNLTEEYTVSHTTLESLSVAAWWPEGRDKGDREITRGWRVITFAWQGNVETWAWKCLLSWLWGWFHRCEHLSKLKLYTLSMFRLL